MKKYLHLMTNEKFNSSYIEFIEKNFKMDEHTFYLWKGCSESDIEILKRENIYKVKTFIDELTLLKSLYKSEKIFLHGLHNYRIDRMLFFNRSCLKKCNWIIWGGDLHEYELKRIKLRDKIKEMYRKTIIKNFKSVTTTLEEEVNNAKRWYGFKGEWKHSFFYPASIFKDIELNKKESEDILIQVGNSSLARNNHVEIFEKLKEYENIEVAVPLSYGNEKNAEYVASEGERILGKRFKPMFDFLKYDEYVEFLGNVDIAIFNHKKHQALGNIIHLLGFGKTVYLNSDDFILKKLIDDLGIKVFDSKLEIKLDLLSEKDRLKNIEIIKLRYSEEMLIKEWKKILEDC